MASTGKKGKKSKGKTVALTEFLAPSWSDEVDEADKLGDSYRKPALPAAPRAARVADIDEKIPKNPPFIAYLSNLSYEVEEEDIQNFFDEYNVINVRLPKDDRTGRLKGFGYVEFGDRQSFVNALKIFETNIKNRRIKIDVADNNDGGERRRPQRDNRERENNYDPEKTSGDWRSGPRSEFSSNDDRRGMSSNNRRDYGGLRENNTNERRGYGRDTRDADRETSSWRDSSDRRFTDDRDIDRDRDRNRDRGDRNNRDNRSSYGGRRNYDNDRLDNNRDSGRTFEPRTRQKLNLKPRTVPNDDNLIKDEAKKDAEESAEPERPSAPPAASIFGQAKPVDTAAREREIEERLAKEKEVLKVEKESEKPRTFRSEPDANPEPKKLEASSAPAPAPASASAPASAPAPAPEPRDNIWVRRSQRSEAQMASSDETKNGRTSDSEDVQPTVEKKVETQETVEESSQKPDDKFDKKSEENDADRNDSENRQNRYNRNDNRHFDRNRENRENDRPYRQNDRHRDDRDRRDRDRRDFDRRDRGYDSEKRSEGGGGRYRDADRDGDSRRYNSERDGERKFNNERDGDRKPNNERDTRRHDDRDVNRHRDLDDHKGPRGEREKRTGPPTGDKGPRKGNQERDRDRERERERDRDRPAPVKDKPKDTKKPTDDVSKMPKLKETAAPIYVAQSKFSVLDEDAASE